MGDDGVRNGAIRAALVMIAFGAFVALSSCAALPTLLKAATNNPLPSDPSKAFGEKNCEPLRGDRRPAADGKAPQYSLEAICDDTNHKILIVFAFSGGGIRSASFGFGALLAANEIKIANDPDAKHQRPGADAQGTPLFDEIDVASGVSGGSMIASALSVLDEHLFDGEEKDGSFKYRFVENFLKHDFGGDLWAIYLEPWRWGWMFPDYGTNDEMADIYGGIVLKPSGERLFGRKNYDGLAAMGRPYLVVQATDFGSEQPFTFTQNDFDLICSNLNEYPLQNAIAASNGFPFIFSPVRLSNYRFKTQDQPDVGCTHYPPPWFSRVPQQAPEDLSSSYERYRLAQSFIPLNHEAAIAARQNVHLQDGGVSDNVALRGLMYLMSFALGDHSGVEINPETGGVAHPEEANRSDAPACQAGLGKVDTVLVVSVDGEALPDNRVSGFSHITGLGTLFDVTTSTFIDSNDLPTLLAAQDLTKGLKREFRLLACGDPDTRKNITVKFAHVSFNDLDANVFVSNAACKPERTAKDPLCSIGGMAHSETSLSYSSAQVDALVHAGHDAFFCNPILRNLFWPQLGPSVAGAGPGSAGTGSPKASSEASRLTARNGSPPAFLTNALDGAQNPVKVEMCNPLYKKSATVNAG